MRRSIRRAFGRYISPETVDKLVRGEHLSVPSAEKRVIPYVVFHVRDDCAEDVQLHLSRAVPIVIDCDGLVENMMCSTVLVSMLRLVPDKQEMLVNALLDALGPNIRLVYGSAEGLFGLVGDAERLNFGSLIPKFSAVLASLGQLEFGSSKKID